MFTSLLHQRILPTVEVMDSNQVTAWIITSVCNQEGYNQQLKMFSDGIKRYRVVCG